jgi:putative DNA primase/helicase
MIAPMKANRRCGIYGAPLYRRGSGLVRPIVEEVDATEKRKTKVARLTQITQYSMLDWLSRAAVWKRFDRRSKTTVRIDPPMPVVHLLLSREGEWRFPLLRGVITTPTIRSDGSLLIEPGYDAPTGLLLVAPPALPPIPAHPTQGRRVTRGARAASADPRVPVR